MKQRILERFLKQKATYWAPSGYNVRGRQIYSAPVQVDVRWEYKRKNFTDAENEQKISEASVYCTTNLEIGGQLGLIALADLNGSDPEDNGGYEILDSKNAPDFKGSLLLYKAML